MQYFPVFDYRQLKIGTVTSEMMLDAVRNFSYFYVSDLNELIPPSMFKSLKEQSEEFFALPESQKMNYYIGSSSNHRGYVPISEKGAYSDETMRVYEAFDLGFECRETSSDSRRGFTLVGANRYPSEIPGLEATLKAYFSANLKIGKTLLDILATNSGLDSGYFDKFTTRPASQLRLLHYLKNDALVAHDDVGMGAHTDYEVFTIIHQTSPGLAAYHRASKTWKQMPIFKNTLLVMAGDMLELMTSGSIKSLLHRVSPSGEERYSFPFFMNLDFETKLGNLPAYEKSENEIVVGHHLIGQLYRDFPYIKDRIDSGSWDVDFPIPGHNDFEKIM